MTLPRKGLRSIQVDENTYRWTVNARDEPGLGIVVQRSDGKGQRLLSWVEHGVIIAPGLVRRAILDGLASGWCPTQAGPDFVRRVPEFSEAPAAECQCAACDHFSLARRGQYDICPVCFWEDDGLDLDKPDVHSGPNHLTLREARLNFARFGACAESALRHVLPEPKRSRFRHVAREIPSE